MENSIHTIRSRDGKTVTVKNYYRTKAIKFMCMECVGWEDDPKDCTSPLCPLFPFRKRTLLSQRGNDEPSE